MPKTMRELRAQLDLLAREQAKAEDDIRNAVLQNDLKAAKEALLEVDDIIARSKQAMLDYVNDSEKVNP